MRHILRVSSGVGLVVLGVLGLILPIMPGWVFLIPGLIILADYFPPVRRLLHWAKSKVKSTLPKDRRWRGRPPGGADA